MQRAAFPELQGPPSPRRHRRQGNPDRMLTGLKVATFLAAAGLLAVIILLAIAGNRNATVGQSPTVPTFAPGDDAPTSHPTTTPAAIDPPALHTETAEIAGRPISTTHPAPRPSSKPPRRPGFEFAVIGQKCSNPGAFSITKDSLPVVCFRRSPSEDPRWFPVF